jgi:hypothetical protein
MLRVLVDTNVWVSALINPSGHPARVLEALKIGKFALILSEPLVDELLDVLSRPRLVKKYGLELLDVAEFASLLEEKAEMVEPAGELQICRDPKDDFLLETALLARADYAVSRDDDVKRDKDVVSHMHEHGVQILSVKQFLEILNGLSSSPANSVS